jgi:hypothetical protein
MRTPITRRQTLISGLAVAGTLAAPAIVQAQSATAVTRRNVSSFVTQNWQDHFDDLGVATIVADTGSRALHYWSGDGQDYRVYPTSVPASAATPKSFARRSVPTGLRLRR